MSQPTGLAPGCHFNSLNVSVLFEFRISSPSQPSRQVRTSRCVNQLEILPPSSVQHPMMGCFPTPPSFTPPHSRGLRTQPHPLPPLPGVANVQVVGARRVRRAAAAQQFLMQLLWLCPCSTHGPRPRPSCSPVAGEHQPIPQLQESPQQKGLRGLAVSVPTLQNSHGQGLVWWPPPTFYPRFSMNFIPDSLLLSPVTPS